MAIKLLYCVNPIFGDLTVILFRFGFLLWLSPLAPVWAAVSTLEQNQLESGQQRGEGRPGHQPQDQPRAGRGAHPQLPGQVRADRGVDHRHHLLRHVAQHHQVHQKLIKGKFLFYIKTFFTETQTLITTVTCGRTGAVRQVN